jgi:Zn-dependent peptidase ImmA (M78 family)/DNA-binding XRE family transcriptional regulator
MQIEPPGPKTVGQRLAQARKGRGLTQAEAAAQLGCSRPTFIAIEKGTRLAKSTEIATLAALYGKSVHEIVRPGRPTASLEVQLRAKVDSAKGPPAEHADAIQVLQSFAEDYRELECIGSQEQRAEYPPEARVTSGARLKDLAEDIAIRSRRWLHLGDGPLDGLREVFEESAGLRIFYWDIPSFVAGIYSTSAELGCCMLVNRQHPPQRRRFTLAHEYAHFLCDRDKPGIDYLSHGQRVPLSERFADAFAASFLMPETAIRRRFLAVVDSCGDFQVADLCRTSAAFGVSVQAMALRLEQLRLLPKGTWDILNDQGFRASEARRSLGLQPDEQGTPAPYPTRYKYLCVKAYMEGKISEGLLSRFLRTDRVSAREIVDQCRTTPWLQGGSRQTLVESAFGRSLLTQD